jgi:hypothetical protein
MAAARHEMPPEIAALSLDEIAERYIGRFRDKIPDWEAFEDAKIEGYRRAQTALSAPAARANTTTPESSRRARSR